MTDGVKAKIKINEDAKTPSEYFDILKTSLKRNDKKALTKQLEVIAQNIKQAKDVGQTSFLHKLSFTWSVLFKEQELLALGYDTYMLRQDVLKFIEKVEPKNSVKIIELARYPRAIPTDVLKKITHAKETGFFDDFCVVFTDFTDDDYQSKEDKEFIAKNRDPVVFGMFEHSESGIIHDRLYLVADWIDDYCDLDFMTMVERMTDVGIERPDRKIDTNSSYLNDLVMDANVIAKNTLEKMNGKKTEKKGLFARAMARWTT